MRLFRDDPPSFYNIEGFDMHIICQNSKLSIHRLVLVAASSYFRGLAQEIDLQDEPLTVFLPDFKDTDVLELVGRLYGNMDQESQENNESLTDLCQVLNIGTFAFSAATNKIQPKDDVPVKYEAKERPDETCIDGDNLFDDYDDVDVHDDFYDGYDILVDNDDDEDRTELIRSETTENLDTAPIDDLTLEGGYVLRNLTVNLKRLDPGLYLDALNIIVKEEVEEEEEEEDSKGGPNLSKVQKAKNNAIRKKRGFVKTYMCVDCDYKSTDAVNYERHRRKHMKRIYGCDQCSLAFTFNYLLNRHKRQVHGTDEDRRRTILRKRELRNQGRKKEIEQLYQEAARDDLSIEDKKGIAERIDMLQQLLNKPMKEIVLRKRREKREEGMKKEKKKSKEKKKDGEVKEEKKKDGNEKEEGPVAAVESKVSEELLKCEECYYKTYLKSAMLQHKRAKHGFVIGEFFCDECPFNTHKQINLYNHKRIVHNNEKKLLLCHLCDYTSTSKSTTTLKDHIKSVHEGIRFSCEQCDYKATSRANLKKHVQGRHAARTLPCDYCDEYVAPSIEYLRSHIKQVHCTEYKYIKKRHKCDQCEFTSTHLKNLREHKQAKHDGIPFSCEQCNFTVGTSKALKRHIEMNHMKHDFACEHCKYTCSTESALKEHCKRVHTGAKFLCDQCSYAAKTAYNLTKHQNAVHSGRNDKPMKLTPGYGMPPLPPEVIESIRNFNKTVVAIKDSSSDIGGGSDNSQDSSNVDSPSAVAMEEANSSATNPKDGHVQQNSNVSFSNTLPVTIEPSNVVSTVGAVSNAGAGSNFESAAISVPDNINIINSFFINSRMSHM